MTMTKQELARARNYFKMVLMGLYKPIKIEALTEYEAERWNKIFEIRDELLQNLDENSRQKGLNIPEQRCFFCNKEAKYTIVSSESKINLCKKHFKIYQNEK